MLQLPELLIYRNLIHAFSEISDGNMGIFFNGVRKDKNEVLANRTEFLRKINVDIGNCTGLWVIHSNNIVEANPNRAGKSMTDLRILTRADGLITNKIRLFLFLLVADCMPIIIFDPIKNAVAVIHAGWPGVNQNIAKRAVDKFQRLYGSNPGKLVIAIGPCARASSFIKTNPSQLNDPKWQGYLEKVDKNTYKVNFVGLCNKQFIDSGIKSENIFNCGIDTVTSSRFFSHVRNMKEGREDQGRFACVVGIA